MEMMMGRTVRQRLLHQCLVAFSSWQGSPAALTRAGRLPWGQRACRMLGLGRKQWGSDETEEPR